MGLLGRVLAAGLLLGVSGYAWSGETVSYSYDAKGRLVGVSRSGTINNGVTANYCYDKADNRAQVTVSSGACAAGSSGSAFGIGEGSADEGDTATFTVTRYGGTASAQAVNYASAGGTATSGTDFTAASGTLSFAAGETSKTVSVPSIQDAAIEASENFVVNLSGATNGATISDTQGSGTITDDDAAPSFAIGDASGTEGGAVTFTVTRNGPASTSYTVNYASTDGTAVAASDYTAVSGTLTFATTDLSKTISVTSLDNSVVESSETFTVTLSSPSGGATLTDAQGTGTIADNDTPPSPTLSVDDVGDYEGEALTFTITRSGDTSASVSVSYATATGTASGNDFTGVSGSVTFAIGETTKTVTVQTTENLVEEDDETFTLNLSNPTGGASISDGQGVGTILNDDGPACPTCRG